MLKKLSKVLYGISAKLFFWFWLTVISSITMTYFITVELGTSSSISNTNKYNLKILNKAHKQLSNKATISIKKAQRDFYRKNNFHLIFKNVKNNNIILPKAGFWGKVEDYIQNNNFVMPVSIEFSNTRISGPKEITINKKNYQLFIGTDNDGQRIHFFLKQFPLWLRILIVFVISFILCWLLAKTLSKPLISIKNAALNFGQGELSTRLNKEASRRDELGEVASSFNIMASQLENNINSHQRLLGDVSHELRSPLTRLQMALGLVEKYQNSPKDQSRHLARCEKEIDQLDAMLSDILTLSRLEHSAEKTYVTEIELDNFLTLIIEDCQYLANAKNVKILAPEKQNTVIYADEKLISSVIGNIINNAVKYSPQNSEIDVVLIVSTNTIKLSVVDQGTGVPEETLAKIFKPFYRVADARDRSSGGTGLGLAIAYQAIELHNGKIFAKNNAKGGLTVNIELPITKQ